MTGIVSGTGKTARGIPFIAVKKSEIKVGMDSILSCSFAVGEAEKNGKLKNGETVTFRGEVNTKMPLNLLLIEGARLR